MRREGRGVAPGRMRVSPLVVAAFAVPVALVTMLVVAFVAARDKPPVAPFVADPTPPLHWLPPQRLRVDVLEQRPHDRSAFTQGLELAGDVLYEGTGMVGRSAIMATDPMTGAVRQRVNLPVPLFGEGITVVDQRIWQLTWRDGVAIERDRATLAELRRVPYRGEGWGLCFDGARLVMSDGTDRLRFRSPATFDIVGEVRVRLPGGTANRLNELECAGGVVWANVWQTDRILRIDPASGLVTGVVDAAGLLTADDRARGANVLNGIAALPGGTEFLITGKLWPHTFRVRFVPA